ncbi:TPA: hypothetical protein U5E42_003541 [Yersinia enterocolitica]|uniref:hypothetical protein n=1 Tax=Yersinia thracica TaxID=2890319 RepID=UPI00157C3C67|nr:hypothetical protein [Yersinia thracica]HEN3663732.1 hypothetical protein [Yersinia enterocolitica]
MKVYPKVELGEWITIGMYDCVIRKIYDHSLQSSVGQVVFNKDKPTTHDFEWSGDGWVFSESSDFGGYVHESDRYVQILKQGKY